MLRFGHRGAAGYEPENTLRSIERALSLNVHGIEIDIRVVEDKIVVFHDDTLERTTNGNGCIYNYTVSELRKLDAGKGEKIPILEEVLDLIDGKVVLNIEIKGSQVVKTLAPLLNSYLEKGYPKDALLLSSFNHRELIACKKQLPTLPIGVLVYGIPYDLSQAGIVLGAYSIHLSREYVSTEMLIDAHSRGLEVYVYTVNNLEEIAKLEALGVDGVFSDFPDPIYSPNISS